MPRPPKAIAMQRLQRALDEIPALGELTHESREFQKWQRNTRVAIDNIFGLSSSQTQEFVNIEYWPRAINLFESNEARDQTAYSRGLDEATAILESMFSEVDEYWEEDGQEMETPVASATLEQTNTNQIFLIHGRDHGTRETVARFLENLGLEPVILQEQPDEGLTIIEKFEQYARVNFAVALFTSDDVGGLPDDGLQPRVRQNVVFELGYFIGKFGRNRVRVLVKGAPEIPSDYSGVLYIPLDEAEGWKLALGRELRNAGFEIETDRIF